MHLRIVAKLVVLTLASALTGAGQVGTSSHQLVTRSVNGREYLAYLPNDHASRTEPMQVLMALHPATFDAPWFQNISRFEQEPAAADVVVIYPNGSAGVGPGLSWDAADPRGTSRGDAEFLLAVAEDVSTVALTKPRFALTGFSAGALMTYRMLGVHGDRISAAVPYAAYYNDSVIASSIWPASVPIMHMHGTDDARVNPITGTGDADHLYNFGILADHMAVVANRNAGSASLPGLDAVEAALDGSGVIVESNTTSYVLLEGVAHYWPRFLNGNGPNGSAAVLEFIVPASCANATCADVDLADPRGELDAADVSAFLVRFDGEQPAADINGDRSLDFFDIAEHLRQYDGCR